MNKKEQPRGSWADLAQMTDEWKRTRNRINLWGVIAGFVYPTILFFLDWWVQ